MTRPTLEELLARTATGDRDAFVELYDHCAPCMYGLAERVTGDPSIAEAVTCEVFVDSWRRSPEFDPRHGSALSWLLDLTHVEAVATARTRTTRSDTAGPERPATSAPPLLHNLPPAERTVVTTVYYGGQTYESAARTLHISPDEARDRIRDGLTHLRTDGARS